MGASSCSEVFSNGVDDGERSFRSKFDWWIGEHNAADVDTYSKSNSSN